MSNIFGGGTGGGGQAGTNTIGMSNLGNTSGNTGVVTGSNVQALIVGGDNITVNQSLDGVSATLSIIGAAGGAAGSNTLGISNLGNTSGTTGVISGTNLQLALAGGNNITLSQSINGSSATVTISGANQTAQTQNLHNLTLSGNTAGVMAQVSSGTLTLAGGNNITLSQDGNAITVSAFNQTVQTQNLVDVSLSGNTAGALALISSGTLTLAGGDNITLSQNGNAVTISGAAGGGAGGTKTIGVSNIGNTSGNTGIFTGSNWQYIFAGGNNITLSQSTMSNSATVTISGLNTSGQGHGVSNLGNTSGNTGLVSAQGVQVVFAGGNNITLSQSSMSNSATITISAGGGAATSDSIGVSNGGNTAGITGMLSYSPNLYVFAGGNQITLSQTMMSNSATVTISGANPGAQQMSFWQNMGVNGSATDAMAQTATSNGQLKIFQLDLGNNIFAGNMTVSTVLVDLTCSQTATMAAHTWKVLFGVYSLNGTRLSLMQSASTSFGTQSSSGSSGSTTTFNVSQSYHGKRYLSFHSSQFSGSGLTLSQGLYYGALLAISSSNTFNASWYGAILGESGQRSGTMGVTSASSTFQGMFPYMGIYSATTASMPNSIANSELQKTGIDAIFIPHIVFNNLSGATTF